MSRRAIYVGSGFREHDGEIMQENGHLTLIADETTGEEDWYAPHEIAWRETSTAPRRRANNNWWED